METKDLGKSSTGLKPNVAALLSYFLGFITGIIFYLIERENKFVRFHAIQSILGLGSFYVLSLALFFIPTIGKTLSTICSTAGGILSIILMIKAYKGEYFKLPIVGDIAEKKA